MALELETSEPRLERCSCCGADSVRVAGFVTENGGALAFYYGAYGNTHEPRGFDLAVCLGDVGDELRKSGERITFSARVLPQKEGGHAVRLVDGASTRWKGIDVLGTQLSRAEALAHPWKEQAFELIDYVTWKDGALRGYMNRCACGDPTEPLELGFGLPDDAFAVPKEERAKRVKATKGLATLDDRRFFIRCMFARPMPDLDQWSVGLWLEVSRAVHDEAWEQWEAPGYARLQFEGTLANDVPPLGLTRGGQVMTARVVVTDQLPYVIGAREPSLDALLKKPWTAEEFRTFAVKHHLL